MARTSTSSVTPRSTLAAAVLLLRLGEGELLLRGLRLLRLGPRAPLGLLLLVGLRDFLRLLLRRAVLDGVDDLRREADQVADRDLSAGARVDFFLVADLA